MSEMLKITLDELDIQKYKEKIEEYVSNQTHCSLCKKENPHLKSHTIVKDDEIRTFPLCEKCYSLVTLLVEREVTK